MHRKCVRSIYVEEAAAKTSSYGDFIWCSITVLRKERAKHSQFLAQLFLHMHLSKYFKRLISLNSPSHFYVIQAEKDITAFSEFNKIKSLNYNSRT